MEENKLLEYYMESIAKDWGHKSFDELQEKEEGLVFTPMGITNLIRGVIKKASKFNQDETDFLSMLIENELNNIKGQLEWYKKHDTENMEHINSREVYIKRLNLLRNKLNDVEEKKGDGGSQ